MEFGRPLKLDERLLKADYYGFKLLVLAFFTGILSGVLSSFFRKILTWSSTFRFDIIKDYLPNSDFKIPLLALITIIAIYIALVLVKKIAPEAGGSGVQEIEGALDNLRPIRWKRVIPVKFFASIFSLGSGLLLGREGPTIQMGANVGKMVKDLAKEPDEKNNPLISTGAAAGLASAFNAPFSGIVFVIEEMNAHFKFNFYSVASIMIGASTADAVVRFLLGSGSIIKMQVYSFSNLTLLWYFALLGAIIGIIGLLFNKTLLFSVATMKKLAPRPIYVAIVLGVIISFAGNYSSDMIEAGYKTIYKALDESFTLQFLLLLLVVRIILSIFSYSSGVPGGIFAPLLTLGVIAGMVFGIVAQSIAPNTISDPGIFAVAGMAAIFASTVRAPITGLALAVEMTSNYELILPLILTSLFAAVTTTMLGNKPIYASLLHMILKGGQNINKQSK